MQADAHHTFCAYTQGVQIVGELIGLAVEFAIAQRRPTCGYRQRRR